MNTVIAVTAFLGLLAANPVFSQVQVSSEQLKKAYLDLFLSADLRTEGMSVIERMEAISRASMWRNFIFGGESLSLEHTVQVEPIEDAIKKIEQFMTWHLHGIVGAQSWPVDPQERKAFFEKELRMALTLDQIEMLIQLIRSYFMKLPASLVAIESEKFTEAVRKALHAWKINLSWIRRATSFEYVTLKFDETESGLQGDKKSVGWGQPFPLEHPGTWLGLKREFTLIYEKDGSLKLVFAPREAVIAGFAIPFFVEIVETGARFQIKSYKRRDVSGPFFAEINGLPQQARYVTLRFYNKHNQPIVRMYAVVDLFTGTVFTYEGNPNDLAPMTYQQALRSNLLDRAQAITQKVNGMIEHDTTNLPALRDHQLWAEDRLVIHPDGSLELSMGQFTVTHDRWTFSNGLAVRMALDQMEAGEILQRSFEKFSERSMIRGR